MNVVNIINMRKFLGFSVWCALIFAVSGVSSVIIADEPVLALAEIGARGEGVENIQSALRDFGYYFGALDGIFGVKTQEAVMRFQESRGFTADGVAGAQTLKALGLPVDVGAANHENAVNLLARLISAEARREPYAGQVAVGAVILNRVKNPAFPDSIAGVIYQPGAFRSIKSGRFNNPVAESAYRAARDALNNIDPVGGAVYFYHAKKSGDQWLRSRPVAAALGNYLFCH